jgi:hypothetical protein
MSSPSLTTVSTGPASRVVAEKREALLGLKTEELAGIHFSILLTARWEAAERTDKERRDELRHDLANLRTAYFDKIDDIAMSFGVQKAMDAKRTIERTVVLERESKPSKASSEAKQYS